MGKHDKILIGLLVLVVLASGCTSSNSNEFKVGNSSFSVPKEYELNNAFNESKMSYGNRTFLNSTEKSISVTEFTDKNSFNVELNDFRKPQRTILGEPLYRESNKTINGTAVTIFEDTGMPFKDYFFEKNGKFYWIAVYLPDNSNIHEELATMIINSLNVNKNNFKLW